MNMFKPKLVLELGMGLYSTPLFVSYNPEELICIDNDENWFNEMKIKFNDKCKTLLHKLDSNISIETFPYQLTDEQKKDIIEYYMKLATVIQNKNVLPKLLFVDNFNCCRTLAINTLYNNFDIMIYHDCEPKGVSWYEYYFVENIKIEFNHYILRTPANWTGCFIRNNIKQDRINEIIIPYIKQFCNENKLQTKQVYLEKEY